MRGDRKTVAMLLAAATTVLLGACDALNPRPVTVASPRGGSTLSVSYKNEWTAGPCFSDLTGSEIWQAADPTAPATAVVLAKLSPQWIQGIAFRSDSDAVFAVNSLADTLLTRVA